MKIAVVTIVSMNYLAYARVLAKSLEASGNPQDFVVLIADRASDENRAQVQKVGLKSVFAEDLRIERFEEVAYKYDIVEFNTAVKPSFLKYIFCAGYEGVVFFDPDIQVFNSISPMIELLSEHEVLLTPHSLTPILDGKRPSDIDFLRNGAYNLGYIAIRATDGTRVLLDWWEHRCLHYGFNDLHFGTFVDQKWVDLVPSYFNGVFICKDPGWNVAYWNLHERIISMSPSGLSVNDRRLIFFHFSGVKPNDPNTLSRHQTRTQLVVGSILAEMVESYCQRLLHADHNRYSSIDYGFQKSTSGRSISTLERRSLYVPELRTATPFVDDEASLSLKIRVGIVEKLGKPKAPKPTSNTMNFRSDDRRVRLLNSLIRAVSRIGMLSSLLNIFRYGAVLLRQDNIHRVLHGHPIRLEHAEELEQTRQQDS